MDLPDTLRAVTFHHLSLQFASDKAGILPLDLEFLLIMYALQAETNQLPTMQDLCLRSGVSSDTVWRRLQPLLNSGYVNRDESGTLLAYNVTEKGEYLIRLYMQDLSRMVNDSKLSRWTRLKAGGDKRKGYLRKQARKGTKFY
jgi:predicted transcriptional regulator